MRNWETLDELNGSGGCEWEKDWNDVQRICRENLGGIEPELIDLSREYWSQVFEPALDSWEKGLTPNPDVSCNQCAISSLFL
jgi:tRNA-specific 2-thiouridylase